MDVDDKLTVIYRAADVSQAHLLKGMLEDHGIPSTIANDSAWGSPLTLSMAWDMAPRVLVANTHAEPARRLALEFDEMMRIRSASPLPAWGTDESAGAETVDTRRDEAWPSCPECTRPRKTVCPTCGAAGHDFRRAESTAAFVEQRKAAPADATSQEPAEAFAEMQFGPAIKKKVWLACPTCDAVFDPEYDRRCECGYDFGFGREEPIEPERESIDLRLFVIVAMVLAAGIAALLYFALILRP
jgi:hypothetical protein